MSKRFWEIDFLRGILILLMIGYHLLFDLWFFAGYPLKLDHWPWLAIARLGAGFFIFLVGISLTLSFSRLKNRSAPTNHFLHYLKRGLYLMVWALLISWLSLLLFPDSLILFGILHLIAAVVILAYPFLRLKLANIIIGGLIMVAGVVLNSLTLTTPWLLWLGLPSTNFNTLDYFPLLPWFGVALLGIATGNILYPGGQRRFVLADYSQAPTVKIIAAAGRHALLIYLIHQPLLIGILLLGNLIDIQSLR